jgi:hypothetical protein
VVRDDYFIPWHEGVEYDRVGAVVYRSVAEGFQNLGKVEFTPAR